MNKIDELKLEFAHLSSQNNKKKKRKEGVYLFIAIDLVKGTEFKIRNNDWLKTFTSFYNNSENLKEKLNNKLSGNEIKVWKTIGDEVVFYIKVLNENELIKIVSSLLPVVNKLEKKINKDNDILHNLKYDKIGLKSTVWIAHVRELLIDNYSDLSKIDFHSDSEKEFNNYMIKVHNTIDFLGPEIDLGFRLSKYGHSNTVVIGAKLASVLYSLKNKKSINNNYLKDIHIVDFQKLKGIWRDKVYPIIWYTKKLNNKNIFLYHELKDQDEAFKSIISNITKGKTSSIDNIVRILSDINLECTIERIRNKIKHSKSILKKIKH